MPLLPRRRTRGPQPTPAAVGRYLTALAAWLYEHCEQSPLCQAAASDSPYSIPVTAAGVEVVQRVLERFLSTGAAELPPTFEVIVDDPGSASWRLKRLAPGSMAVRLAYYPPMNPNPDREQACAAANEELVALALRYGLLSEDPLVACQNRGHVR